ncbi:MAG: DUF1449 family protein [Flavobacteriales bacterium]|nr:DUF1449 family protein [Flavobacteriales bacterium]
MFVIFLSGMVDILFSAANIIPTLIFCFVMSYWVLVIFGALDLSSFDVELDIDFETDISLDVEMDYEAELGATGENDISFLNNVLKFFNLGDIPLMVFLSFWVIPTLFGTVYINDILGIQSFFFSLITLLPIGFVSLFIAKFTTIPFVKIFRSLENQSETSGDLLGRIVTIKYPITETKMGQAEAFINGGNFLLNVKTNQGNIEKGEQAMIVKFISKDDCYLVEPHFSID